MCAPESTACCSRSACRPGSASPPARIWRASRGRTNSKPRFALRRRRRRTSPSDSAPRSTRATASSTPSYRASIPPCAKAPSPSTSASMVRFPPARVPTFPSTPSCNSTGSPTRFTSAVRWEHLRTRPRPFSKWPRTATPPTRSPSPSAAPRPPTSKSEKDCNPATASSSPTSRSSTATTTSRSSKGTHMNESLIRLDGVNKVFLTDELETHALNGVHLEINRGEYVSIAGPSGSAKSTLLSVLVLLDAPTSGQYSLAGESIESLGPAERARIRNREIGFIFQAFNLIGALNVYENVELPLTYRRIPAADRKRRVDDALERVGMAHRMRHYPAQLSGGQQQRVAVARALAGSPSILLADEPTGNLDSKNGEAVMKLLQELHQEGATICMVTHDPRFAAHAERQIHLFDGKVVAEGELKHLIAEADQQYRTGYNSGAATL